MTSVGLSPSQLRVLDALAAGEALTRRGSPTLATSIYALRNRGLVRTQTRTGGDWIADLTSAGAEAVRTRQMPPPVAPAQPGRPRRSESVTSLPARAAALRTGSLGSDTSRQPVVAGSRGATSPRRTDDVTVVVRATHRSLGGRVNDRGLLSSSGDDAVDVSVGRESLPRALDLVREILLAARAAGGQIRTSTPASAYGSRRRHCGVALVFDGFPFSFAISEDTERVPHTATRTELAEQARHSWARIPEWDYRPSGRLAVRLEPSVERTQRAARSRFADGLRAPVETKVPALIDELQARAAAGAAQRRENARLDAVYAERRDGAVDRATAMYLDDLRTTHLRRQVERWNQARLLRDFAAAMRHRPHDDSTGEWIDWVGRRADRLDPPDTCPPAPELPDDVPDFQLSEYLRNWPELRPWGWTP